MNLFYEEAGAFKVGKVLQEQGSAFQVETLHGKRSKVKANNVMMKFSDLEGHAFAQQVESTAVEIDIELLWECAPSEEFHFTEMADLYFGDGPTPVQNAAVLTALHSAPVYFHRKGKGSYRAAPEDILKAALAGLEKKRRLAEQQDAWADALANKQLPAEIRAKAAQLLARPDKNSLEYKALIQACAQAGNSPEWLLLQAGAFDSIHDLMRSRFQAVYFPRGTAANAEVPETPEGLARLPVAPVRAFSIDDSTTTEIDDAFSVQRLEGSKATVGVHISAPALWIERGSDLEKLARDRMSTVYAPGEKITMLPDALIQKATLAEGKTSPAASIYVDVDLETGELIGEPRSLLEQVPVVANLRHNLLDDVVTKERLETPGVEVDGVGDFFPDLQVLWKASIALRTQRELVRGQPEKHGRIDYTFVVHPGDRVEIRPRRRDAPLDLLVSEWMIFVNSAWGALLEKYETAGIYRVQPQAGRVRMSTHAAPHVGLGVAQYAWSTSPLRRYVDLVNQHQLVSVIRGLPPVYEPSDADLLSAVNAFDVTYKAYAEFQANMERYWCLRWLRQEQRSRFEGVVVRDELVRLHEIPLFVRLVGVTSPGRGAQVEVELDQVDEMTLTVSCKLLGIQSGKPTLLVDADELEDEAEQTEADAAAEGGAEEENSAGETPQEDNTGK